MEERELAVVVSELGVGSNLISSRYYMKMVSKPGYGRLITGQLGLNTKS